MFEDVGANDKIYGIVLEIDVFDVKCKVGEIGSKIGTLITLSCSSEERPKPFFRREVQELRLLVDAIWIPLKIQPNEAMAFKRIAFWTSRIVSRGVAEG